MPQAIFSLPYFGPISFYAALIKYDEIFIEAAENYQKQTHRNRQYIYGANGKLMLNIPVKRSQNKERLTYRKSEIENEFDWQNLHFKSLETAYRTSPYFEFYEEEILTLFGRKFNSLFEFNLECFKTTIELLNIDMEYQLTENYQKEYQNLTDHRGLVLAKGVELNINKSYHQVFEDKHGFISDLSILDLIFNLGPECRMYLRSIDLSRP
jgi:hypothetical protein